MIAPIGFSYCTEKLVLQWFDVTLWSLVDQEGCGGQSSDVGWELNG